jgi:hypothetical protein
MELITNQAPLFLFSTEQMPYANKALAKGDKYWFGADSQEKYEQKPHPLFGPNDIVYNFNTHGYRCPEFASADPNAISVVSIGASEVLGTGLPEDKTFPHVFTKLLEQELGVPVINWNLGIGGSSADYVARILVSALPVLKPDVVLLVFPFYGRREHINDDSRVFYYNRQDTGVKNQLKERILSPETFVLNQANMTLSSEYNDQVNFYKNYQVCESLCEKYGAMWLFSALRASFFEQIMHLVKTDHLISPGLGELKEKYKQDVKTCVARDFGHPGINPNKEMAENMLMRIKHLYPAKIASLKTS